MTTTVNHCGSKWAGEAPDTVADLLAMLAKEPLDPRFEEHGDFATHGDPALPRGVTRFWGDKTPTEAEARSAKAASLRASAANLRALAARGMSPRKYGKAADRLEAEAAELEQP